jgi:diadenosine tetraphosphate (Ap4A) HIT family hydrolase
MNSETCAFCKIAENLKEFKNGKDGKSRWIMENKYFLVILDKYPKVTGHTLVISKRHAEDITKLTDNESRSLASILIKASKMLKESLGAEKVYMMTICEHWEPIEINSKWNKGQTLPSTTEHFHFQLLPRYKEMRTKEIAQENMFTRPQDYGCTLEMLNLVRRRIQRRKT